MDLFFVLSYVASKIEKKEKMKENVGMVLKRNFSNHGLMMRLNLSLDNVRNCEEPTILVKECQKIIIKKKGILNLACKQGLLFKIQKV